MSTLEMVQQRLEQWQSESPRRKILASVIGPYFAFKMVEDSVGVGAITVGGNDIAACGDLALGIRRDLLG
jgi:hypothetical protein